MNKFIVAVAAALTLAACGGGSTPFEDAAAEDSDTSSGDGSTDGNTDTDGGTAINGDRSLPPGTASPQPTLGIFRSEPTSTQTGATGNGFATGVSYDSANDTFTVDNLGFDGDNTYSRGTAVSSLGPYAVYEADQQVTDGFSGNPVNQLSHRAIYGVSTSGNSRFAIVRTGAYVDYGFGGFIYQRDNGVTLPSTGQALYNGVMAGMRDFNGAGGLEYTTADIALAIDFDDFNDSTGTRGDAVRGFISNRTIYDASGNDITSTVVSRIEQDNNISLGNIPTAVFTVQPGVLDDNGEMLGTVQSYYTDSSGQTAVFEQGNYYAIVSGNNAEEVVGIVVLESTLDPISSSVRDTSGFVAYR
ncbi:hypothetical protein [Primorskyibacter sp. S87]|uniref:hypothetical protein n=1 Tax=Primorskyibacter sp. S87 TaxID=3415126 RepID=UPI003C7E2922